MKQLDVRNPFNAPVYHEDTAASTMDMCRDLAARGEPHGTVAAVDFQTAGRGRIRERTWHIERGTSLPFTILLRYPRIEDIPAALTLRAGLAIALAIEDCVPVLRGAVLVKWPNDIMIRVPQDEGGGTSSAAHMERAARTSCAARKAAGILTEADGGIVYIGVGVNVAQSAFPADLKDKATSLLIASGGIASGGLRFTLLERILFRLHDALEAQAAEAWKPQLEERLFRKGEQVRFAEGAADSGKTVEGQLTGIGADGSLLITPHGETIARPFITGELLFAYDAPQSGDPPCG